jgi:hypothetical protein
MIASTLVADAVDGQGVLLLVAATCTLLAGVYIGLHADCRPGVDCLRDSSCSPSAPNARKYWSGWGFRLSYLLVPLLTVGLDGALIGYLFGVVLSITIGWPPFRKEDTDSWEMEALETFLYALTWPLDILLGSDWQRRRTEPPTLDDCPRCGRSVQTDDGELAAHTNPTGYPCQIPPTINNWTTR